MTVRLALVSGHYRSQIDYNEGLLRTAKNNLEKIHNTLDSIKNASYGKNNSLISKAKAAKLSFIDSMDNDFNTSKALAVIYALVKEVNKVIGKASKKSLETARDLIIELMGVLGVDITSKSETKGLSDELIKLLIKLRKKARKNKDYKLSDDIRSELKKLGVILEDSPKGTNYKLK
jgi:cysteinyl-tRNA synthetase